MDEKTCFIKAKVRGVEVEINDVTIKEALGIKSNIISHMKANLEFGPKYMAMFRVSTQHYSMDGTNMKGFSSRYWDIIKSLVELMCVKKKSSQDSNEL